MNERATIADLERRLADAEAALRHANERAASDVYIAKIRLNAFLVRFQESVRGSLDPTAVAVAACRLVTEELGVDRAYWSEVDWKTREFVIGADYAASGAESISGRFPLDAWEPFSSYHLEGRPVVVGDTTSDPRITPDLLRGYEALGIQADLAVPVLARDKLRSVLAVNQSAPRTWTSNDVELVQSAAAWCWTAVERARAEATARESEERQAFLLKLSDEVRPLGHPADIQGETTRLLREKLNAGWCYYVDWDLERRTGVVLRDSVSLGLPSLAGSHDVSDATEFLRLLEGGAVLTVRDYADCSQLPTSTRQKFTALGFRSMMVAPLFKGDRLIASLLVGDTALRDWSSGEASLLVEVGERTWAAIERGRAESALRESEEKYRTLYTKMGQAYIEIELIRDAAGNAVDYRYLVLNSAYERLTGIPIDKALGRPSLEVIPDLSSFWAETFQRIVDNQTAEEFEYEEKALDRWFGIYAYPGDGDRLTVLALDITERKKAEAALRTSEARFQQFANASAAGMWIRDAATLDMEYVSPAVANIYGVSLDALLDRVHRWAGLIVPEDRDTALKHLERARQGEAVVHEFRIQRRTDGIFRWIRNTDFPLFDGEGRIQRIGGLAEDITDTKLAIEHQSVLLAELQHRVRNIMALIRSIINRTAERAETVAGYREAIMGRLMALARVQALLTRSAHVSVGIASIVHDEVSAQAQNEGQYRLDGPDVTLSPKAAEVLTLAIHELTTNAVKYGALSLPDGKVTARWSTFERRGGPWLAFDWTEEGAPAPPQITPNAPRRRGFGLELIEERIPYELRGRGQVIIEPGGARCHLEIPLEDGASILETGTPQRATVFGGTIDMRGEPDLTGRRVLVVEDDYYLATDAARALRGAGAEVMGPCATEADARAELEEQRPDAVVVDINLGPGPSFKLAETLKDRGIPFVFTTGYDAEVIPAEFEDAERLEKPLQLRQIVGAVAKLTATL